MTLLQRVLSPIVEVRKEETVGLAMMFAYSFLAMTAYNILKPVTRSAFIKDLGADNLPYVLLASGVIIGVLMTGYSWVVARLPRRSALAIIQLLMAAVLVGFWFLFQTGAAWASAAFYVMGLLLGVLLISQFWTVANLVYDPRQAKRLFGFIGGGAPLGGIVGSYVAIAYTERVGTTNLLLVSGVLLVLSATLVWRIMWRTPVDPSTVVLAEDEKGVKFTEAITLLRDSKHLQIIGLVISFAAVGAAIVEQQLNMAAQASKGQEATDAITVFLATVQLWTSTLGFVIQVWLTSKIHRYLGIGFALLVLPVSLGASAVVMLFNAALWAPGLARVLDTTLRYTVDKTTREILFLPLDADIKLKAKSFVDVTVDRGAKAIGALLLLVLVKPWGLGLDWQRLSYASLTVMAVWIFMSFRARRGYLAAFRQSIERRNLQPTELRLASADLSTIETLVQELSHFEPVRVIYAIDMLESLEKSSLVTPLLLYHESAQVRARALRAMGEARTEVSAGWIPQVRRALGDADAGVRAAALRALGSIAREDAASLARPLLADSDPRIRATAAVALASSSEPRDVNAAEATLAEIVLGAGDTSRTARVEVAAALGEIRDSRFQRLLIPLLHDEATAVADQAMESVRRAGAADFIFVPALVSLLRNRHLKGRARAVLVDYGEPVVDALAYFMADESEDPWVRRHIPSTLAMIESQKSVDVLTARLADRDGFLRYKVISALVRLRQSEKLTFPAPAVEENIVREARHFYEYLSMLQNLATAGQLTADPLIAAALQQKMQRAKNRIYQLLALVYPPGDIAAAEWTLNYGESRNRASASEYLDNILTGMIRKMVMPIVEELPQDERVRRANVLIRTRPRDVEETLLNLINDDDQVISAAAIDMVRQERVWTLSEDIEHVLAHRDVRDWYVFEAASWTLAEQRMPPDRRRALWREAIPAVVLVGQLRRLPLFASVSIDELFRIAAGSRQVRHEAGTTLLVERAIPEMLHVLLEGEVIVSTEGRPVETLRAPSTMGFMEALQSKTSKRTVRTSGIAVTLAVTAEELRTQLAYNPELVRGLFASMADRVDSSAVTHVFPTGAASELERFASGGMQPIEKVLAIERVPVFAHISPEEARHLAVITHTVEMKEGAALFRATDPPGTWLILSGEVTLSGTQTASPAIARGGDAVGSFGALGGPRIGRDAMVTKAGIALRIDRDELFEILGDRPEMLRQLFEGMVDVSTPAGRTVAQSNVVL